MEKRLAMGNGGLVLPIYEWRKEKGLTNYYGFSTFLWEKDVPISVTFGKPMEQLTILEKYHLVKIITKELNWIEHNKEAFVAALVNDGMIDLAEDWASSSQEVEGKEDCYEMEDGKKVQLPISKEDFSNSLTLNSLGIDFERGFTKYSVSVFFECSPDYFAYHSINVMYDLNHNIQVGGLFG